MHSIILTEFYEKMCVDVLPDDDKLPYNSNVGYHDYCGGYFRIKPISETHNCLICLYGCGLRIVIPKGIDTYGKLRKWCEETINANRVRKNQMENISLFHTPVS